MASVRSRARFEASMVSPGISPGLSWWALNSIRPAVTTLARWLILLRSATLMASSMRPSFKAPATAGANARDCLRAALKAIQRSIITPMDQPDMMNRMMTTILAAQFIWRQREIGSQPTGCSWIIQAAKVCICTNATVVRLAKNMSRFPPPELLNVRFFDISFGPKCCAYVDQFQGTVHSNRAENLISFPGHRLCKVGGEGNRGSAA